MPHIANALGVRYEVVPIESAVLGLEQARSGVQGLAAPPREPAGARGVILMAISNKHIRWW
jgi:hypothetical protein